VDFFTLLIILFIVSRVVEALRSSGTRPPPVPPGQRRGQGIPRAPGQLPQERPQPGGVEGSPASTSQEERAAAMIPEDLWELLTGEKRPRPTPSQAPPPTTALPKPMPVPEEEFDPWGEGMARDEEALTEELRTSRLDRTMLDEDEEAELLIARRREALADRDPERTAKVVSLLTEVPKPAVRHARFHRRLDALEAPPPPPRPNPAARLGLRTTADLRHAFVLNEVLGRPRALEDDDRPA
jgi:hypothetical protein